MPITESRLPVDWFAHGDQDIAAAEILLTADGPLPIVAFLLQQATEKYLKGYLLAQNWPLRRIHDLEILIQEVITRDGDFSSFLAPLQRITEYYIESRYPIGISTPLVRATLEADLATIRLLITLTRQKLNL